MFTAGSIFGEVFCHELLQDTKVEDPNAVYLMKGNPHTESKTCKGHNWGRSMKQNLELQH